MRLETAFEKIVFLLGAGASKDAGCLLSTGMLSSLRKAIDDLDTKSDEYIKYKEDFSEIYQFILASLHYQSTMRNALSPDSAHLNVEDFVMILRQLIDKEYVIPYPLIGNWNDKIIKWELRNGDVFSQFKDFIVLQLIQNWTNHNKDDASALLNPIVKFLTVSENVTLNIFSLNYDLVFEETLNSPTLRVLDDGFSERIISDQKIKYWTEYFNHPSSASKVNLYKLHGSLNWEYDSETEDIQIKDDIHDSREPLIIFGSYSKMLSFDPFLYILSEFRKMLSKATMIISIGYSFHDKYINNLLIQQLSMNTEEDIPKKMLIVDPSNNEKTENDVADELRKIQDSKSINDVINFKQISPERIELIPKTASDFYKEYFSNNGKKFIEELESIEQADKIF